MASPASPPGNSERPSPGAASPAAPPAARRWNVERLLALYDLLVLRRPAVSVLALAAATAVFCRWIPDFRLDASGDALVLEHDDDVRYYRAMSSRYDYGDFVVITYTPPEDLFSTAAIGRLRRIRMDLSRLRGVSSVVTMLDVPLLRNPPGTLKELKDNIKTLESPKADLKFAVSEFRTSPIYQNLIVGQDLKSTAIQINFSVPQDDIDLVSRRSALREKRRQAPLVPTERRELRDLERRYRAYKDDVQDRRHGDILAIRRIIGRYRPEARFFLGGVPMIVEDIMSYIRSDLIVFGFAMLAFVMTTLYLIYRLARWVLLPMLCCVAAVLIMMGGMGLLEWDVTVVSSNFVSLQLILTMSIAIHIISHYRELLRKFPEADNHELVLKAVRGSFAPCLFATLTTIAGFQSLVFCDILPVVQFGSIMTMGLVLSMIIVYWLLPAGMAWLPKPPPAAESEFGTPVTGFFARMTERRRPLILAGFAGLAVATGLGISRLEVENSFIDYFRTSTDIYQGMKFIDEELGGTTPLDIIVEFKTGGPRRPLAEPGAGDKEFEGFEEFEAAEKDPSKYWYTTERLAAIGKVHDYLDGLPETGKVLSLATLYKTAVDLNGGKAFDNFALALLYNAISDKFRSILVTPYVSVERDEARITTRIKDSRRSLRRAELIARVRRDLVAKVGLREDQFRVSGLMLLYNNMLQSLFSSQIKTIGTTVAALLVMLVILFRSLKLAAIALLPQLLSSLSVLGIMGLGGVPLDVMTITIVSIAIGIGIDDAIHYVYRFRFEIEAGAGYLEAMHRCHSTIGNAMYYTSLAITAGFSILAFSNFVPTVLFGLLTGAAMVTACVSSQTLLPALILLTKPFGPGKT